MLKFKILLTISSIILFSFATEAQDILGALNENAEIYNEQHGRETQSNQNDVNNSPSYEEYIQNWHDMLNDATEEFKAELNGLGDYEKCAAMMVIYLDYFYQLDEKIKEESNCKMKYDLYGMQLLGLTAANTILYCPEKIQNLSDENQAEALSNFVTPHTFINSDGTINFKDDDWGPKLVRLWEKYSGYNLYVYNPDDLEYNLWVKWMYWHFHPVLTLSRIAEIGEKMEALGCGG